MTTPMFLVPGTVWLTVNAGEPGGVPAIPEALLTWLRDLVLLRHVPTHYLIPREDLLPAESIRFFYVDPVWIDRLLDGVLSAGNLGTQDRSFAEYYVRDLRKRLQPYPSSGMLIRSDLVRRWPGLHVRAYAVDPGSSRGIGEQRLTTLRLERLAPGLMIALFDGVPVRVDIEEPGEGTRFGVEADAHRTRFTLNERKDDGTLDEQTILEMPMHRGSDGKDPCVLNVREFARIKERTFDEDNPPIGWIGAVHVAWQLQQESYVQICRMSDPSWAEDPRGPLEQDDARAVHDALEAEGVPPGR